MHKIYIWIKELLNYVIHPTQNYEKLKKSIHDVELNLNYALVRQRYELLAFHSNENGTTPNKYGNEEIVISLTSYGKRVQSVFLTIESLFQQTLKANHVVLYLSKKEFSLETIPEIIKKQQKRGLSVRFVEDKRSYTKLVYALKDYPEASIINVDDDFIYPIDHIEKIINEHQKKPNNIICGQVKEMKFNKKEKKFTSYTSWQVPRHNHPTSSPLYLQYGAFGCLYPPHSLHEDVFDETVYLKLAPTADDLWFKIMAIKKGTQVEVITKDWSECGLTGQIHNFDSVLWRIEYVQDNALGITNVANGQNDVQLHNLCLHYDLYEYFASI